mmetsp:Transcript_1846/g.3277  ORF Transcript_1846/g.3277 Transcript_1846/m.3277 type:complete len:89 (-) Transcript_1846:52-318(-)
MHPDQINASIVNTIAFHEELAVGHQNCALKPWTREWKSRKQNMCSKISGIATTNAGHMHSIRDAVLSDIKASSPASDAESCAASQSFR